MNIIVEQRTQKPVIDSKATYFTYDFSQIQSPSFNWLRPIQAVRAGIL